MREQRLVFGEAAELYDRARAGYPESVVDEVLEFTGADEVRALEVGAGTGKATVSFAERGVEILALEPDPSMAAVAIRNCQKFAGVQVEITSFEDWPLDRHDFDLVFSAQAWHWIRPEVRFVKASQALRAGGTLALFWHRVRWQPGDPLRDELDALYQDEVPDLYARRPGFPGLSPSDTDVEMVDQIDSSGLFSEVQVRFHPWSANFTVQQFIELLSSQSDHRLLQADQRARLFDGIGELFARAGGPIAVPFETFVLLVHPVAC